MASMSAMPSGSGDMVRTASLNVSAIKRMSPSPSSVTTSPACSQSLTLFNSQLFSTQLNHFWGVSEVRIQWQQNSGTKRLRLS